MKTLLLMLLASFSNAAGVLINGNQINPTSTITISGIQTPTANGKPTQDIIVTGGLSPDNSTDGGRAVMRGAQSYSGEIPAQVISENGFTDGSNSHAMLIGGGEFAQVGSSGAIVSAGSKRDGAHANVDIYNLGQGSFTVTGHSVFLGTVTAFTYYGDGSHLSGVVTASSTPSLSPTRQIFLSGSGIYTTPSTASQIRIRMIAGGGGGGAATTNAGSNGGDTSFDVIFASHGLGGNLGQTNLPGVVGGIGGIGSASLRIQGGGGCGSVNASGIGNCGGSSVFGGGAPTSANSGDGQDAAANSGSGGSGGSNAANGGGGSAGEYVEIIISSPASSYSYSVGAGGTGGAAGSKAGGNGGSGIIIVDEIYPSGGGSGSSSSMNTWKLKNFISQVNGSKTQFDLTESPTLNSERVVLDGLVLTNGTDYSISGTTVTVTTAPASTSSVFNVQYVVGSSGTSPGGPCTGSGGTITTSGGFCIHTFSMSGTFSAPASTGTAEILIVAGGGGGSTDAGGGGAGGLLHFYNQPITGSDSVTVGAGGVGGVSVPGTNGSDSVFVSSVAFGGGGGGQSAPGIDGGSGGGAGNSGSGLNIGGFGVPGQGNNGGTNGGFFTPNSPAGGGGGAGTVGGDAPFFNTAGNGGNGLQISISGTSVYYAGGGGGAGDDNTITPGTGGLGGGGNGTSAGTAVSGTAGLGGGGGGAVSQFLGGMGGNGGSGVVIVRYPIQ